jgi:hypothetical protein
MRKRSKRSRNAKNKKEEDAYLKLLSKKAASAERFSQATVSLDKQCAASNSNTTSSSRR